MHLLMHGTGAGCSPRRMPLPVCCVGCRPIRTSSRRKREPTRPSSLQAFWSLMTQRWTSPMSVTSNWCTGTGRASVGASRVASIWSRCWVPTVPGMCRWTGAYITSPMIRRARATISAPCVKRPGRVALPQPALPLTAGKALWPISSGCEPGLDVGDPAQGQPAGLSRSLGQSSCRLARTERPRDPRVSQGLRPSQGLQD